LNGRWIFSFNPCFNGSMYKNVSGSWHGKISEPRFNPCFNGSMYKNERLEMHHQCQCQVSILVLMDLCIKTQMSLRFLKNTSRRFNPCFNGSMYKNSVDGISSLPHRCFNPCFNGSMYKNQHLSDFFILGNEFQSLF